MITGDNPLTAIHVARDVEIVDRDALILDLKEEPANEGGTPFVDRQSYATLTLPYRSSVADCGRKQDYSSPT
jgi:magnesium-transporting ATPase (P-type)